MHFGRRDGPLYYEDWNGGYSNFMISEKTSLFQSLAFYFYFIKSAKNVYNYSVVILQGCQEWNSDFLETREPLRPH